MIVTAVRKCMALLVVTTPLPGLSPSLPPGLRATSIPNLRVVTEGVYRGGRPLPADVETLARQGIKTIINLQGRDSMPGIRRGIEVYQPGERRGAIEAERSLSESLGLTYLNIPFNSLAPVSSEDAAQILRAVEALADPAHRPVFIHCEHGRDRTGLVVAILRVLHQGWTPERAFDEWVELGHAGWLTLKFTGNLDAQFNRVMREAGRPEVRGYMTKEMIRAAAAL